MKYILIHGLGQDASSWNETCSALGFDGVRCPDLSSFITNSTCTYANLYKALCEFCETEDNKLNLCGLSLGSVLALNYAIDYPDRVESLALIAAQYKMPQMLLKFQNAVFRLMPKSAFGKMGFQKKDFLSLCGSMATLDFSRSIQSIQCPTLLICGEKDSANRNASEELSKRMASANLRVIKNAGHEVNTCAAKELASELCAFWNETHG